ncbi:formyl-CoA transferase/CoA:oxalate CoA-transferase [Actinacidiphila alni]|uniref:Formyl-CoA transferase/CoA:oxalate CoA-transferase n=1 Tax=Actinacidiphila alni TaxID=380248 RepID=A0A1I2K0Z0_9ACTN|nr:CoA transferase [Actinacidiphila alni]SFF58686.1 formyl-CoA transferase/CoA:oxalate CoA-transferase [Actinacidiphila alni]
MNGTDSAAGASDAPEIAPDAGDGTDIASDGADIAPGALDGVKVLDLTRFLQGPYATRILADLGADVVKVERPGGEWDRRLRQAPDGFAGFFTGLNRGKKSIAVDITTSEGRDIVKALARECDVVVENFRLGVMEKLGLGYDTLRQENPRLVYAAASGHGPLGPHSGEPMFDMVAQAVSGLSDFVRTPDGQPRLASRGMADSAGAVFLAMGILTALLVKERTGHGQRVDGSLVGSCLAMHTAEVTIALHGDEVRRTQGRVTSTSGAFRCGDDRWIVIGATDQKVWDGLTGALGRPDLRDDPRFARSRIRERHRDILEPVLEEIFRTADRDTWVRRMRDHGVPVAPVNTFVEAARDPDVLANGFVVEQPDPDWGTVRTVGNPFLLSATPARVGGWTPELGADTREVLGRLGFPHDRIERLLASGVVEQAEAPDPDGPARAQQEAEEVEKA